MKKYVCMICGYTHEGDAAPDACPICKAPAAKFQEQAGEKTWAAVAALYASWVGGSANMAAMEAGTYRGNNTFKSGKFTASDGTVISDWNGTGFGTITYDQGFQQKGQASSISSW